MEKILNRDVTTQECDWLDEEIKKGTTVYEFHGCTYGCVSPGGVAVTLEDGKAPFFEIPADSIGEG